ncbi:hypothetical protein PO909_009248 [Leuciscus waleckii]
MDLPAIQLLCLEKLDRSLEDHTREFLDLVCLTHYSDCSKARLPANGPSEDFAAYVVWVLVNSGLEFTIDPEEDISSPTLDSEPSQTRCVDMTPELIADGESAPAAMEKPSQEEAPDQVCEPATSCAPEEVIVEFEGMERSPAHTPATERELLQDQSLLVFGEDEPL